MARSGLFASTLLPACVTRQRAAAAFRCAVTRSSSKDSVSSSAAEERSEADKLVDGMTFGQLCDDFECVSSPAVEATCRQLARDILEMRDRNRALTTLADSVKFKDPLRRFQGRGKYTRSPWAKVALESPCVAVRQMEMTSTSTLRVVWTVAGRPKAVVASFLAGDLVLKVISTFNLNQISGQVLEHQDEWDLSGSSLPGQAYFWFSRLLYSTVEAGKDTLEAVQGITDVLAKNQSDDNIYADPTDPRKFFQVEDNRQRDLYQVGLAIALLYLLVQILKLTL